MTDPGDANVSEKVSESMRDVSGLMIDISGLNRDVSELIRDSEVSLGYWRLETTPLFGKPFLCRKRIAS